MKAVGYGELYINRYKMFSKFYQKRIPLIILISGTGWICKSSLVTQIS